MKITKNKVVTLDYTVTNTDGQVIDDGRNPIVYLHGGYDDTFPLIEKALNDKKVGDRVSVTLKPKDAFGEYDDELVTSEKASLLPKNVKVGMSFKRVYENGEEEIIYRITDVVDDKVVLDGNHPFAGKTLIFSITVKNVRAGNADEVAKRSI